MLNPRNASEATEVFISYCHKDESLFVKLTAHLATLRRQDLISVWHDRRILPGSDWSREIDEHVNSAGLILLLVSPDFLHSDYCYDVEVKRAMERHRQGEAQVVPVILRPSDWSSCAFSTLQALPRDGKPIVNWRSHDHGFQDVVAGLREILRRSRVDRRIYQDVNTATESVASDESTDPDDCAELAAENFASGGPVAATMVGADVADVADVELTIAVDPKKFTEGVQRKLISAIELFLSLDQPVKIIRKRSGSVRITLRLTHAQAERLRWAVEEGEFAAHDVVGIDVLEAPLPLDDIQSGQRPTLDKLYGLIEFELEQVELLLRSRLRSRDPYVDELVRYGCLLGGKRLRPALLLLSGKAVGELEPAHCTLATVVEMIHTATLVHDDVLDEVTTRGHLTTINARWDNEASVLLGDFLFTQAFYLASSLDDVFACRAIGQATNIVCEGELRQKGSRGDFGLTEEDYYSIIEAKTAELCACSCLLGARYAHADPPVVQRLEAFGRYLGIAFQIADDILDIVGTEETTGKPLVDLLQQQKPTLPLIRLLQVAAPTAREQIVRLVTSDAGAGHPALRELMRRHETVTYAEQQARRYAAMAAAQLVDLPGREAVEVLHLLTEFVVRHPEYQDSPMCDLSNHEGGHVAMLR